MENSEVVVKQKELIDWVNSMVTVVEPKKLRICIDPRDLNEAIRREHFPITTIEEVVADMPQAKVLSVLNATSGYCQVKLDEASSKLCTFNTPFGRYRFTKVTIWNKISPLSVSELPHVRAVRRSGRRKSDCWRPLVRGKDDDEHDERLKRALTRAREVNLKFNAKKCKIKQDEVPCVGHVLRKDGLKPDPKR